jgi:hypothetical protein
MVEVIKHTYKYGEFRTTELLNLHTKDEIGRHRGHVLYGMRVLPSGPGNPTQITIRPGAIYTPYGTRFYWDVISPTTPGLNTIDLATIQYNGNPVLSVANQPNYPLVVAVFMYFVNNAGNSVAIEDEAEFGTATAKFSARVVTRNQLGNHPDLYLAPVDPVGMSIPQSTSLFAGDFIDTTDASTSVPPIGSTNEQGALQTTEILLGYMLIGYDNIDAVFPTTVYDATGANAPWANGIVWVQARNHMEAIEDWLGQDVLLGRTGPFDIIGAPHIGGTATSQVPTDYHVGTSGASALAPLMRSPQYGTPAPNGSAPFWETPWSPYRLPSFFEDGENLLWNLRRLDYFLRLWMDRTGDQQLINDIQDGALTGALMAPLELILPLYDGGTSSSTNKNAIHWPDFGASFPTTNFAAISGLISHAISDYGSVALPYGDNHRTAIEAIDAAVWVILTRLLGTSIPQSVLRNVGVSTPYTAGGAGTVNDFPQDQRGLTPSVSGAFVDPFLGTTSNILAMALEALKRSVVGHSGNWLANGQFLAGDITTGAFPFSSANLPPWWSIGGGSSGSTNWTRTEVGSAPPVVADVVINLEAGAYLYQTGYIGTGIELQALLSTGLLSASATLQNTGASNLQLTLILYSDNLTTPVATMVSGAIAPSAVPQAVQMSARISGSPTIKSWALIIQPTVSAVAAFTIQAAAINVGVPDPAPSLGADFFNFVSRDGGVASAMREPLNMGSQKINSLAAGSAPTDGVNVSQITPLAPINSPVFTGVPMAPEILNPLVNSQIATAGDLAAVAATEVITKLITSSTTYTIPGGYTNALVLVSAAGGGGAGGHDNGGGGGAAGSLVAMPLIMNSGDTIQVTIGAGGAGGGGDGGPGGDTILLITRGFISGQSLDQMRIVLKGGGGGQAAGGGGAAGVGGIVEVGIFHTTTAQSPPAGPTVFDTDFQVYTTVTDTGLDTAKVPPGGVFQYGTDGIAGGSGGANQFASGGFGAFGGGVNWLSSHFAGSGSNAAFGAGGVCGDNFSNGQGGGPGVLTLSIHPVTP